MTPALISSLLGHSAPIVAVTVAFALARKYLKTPARDVVDAEQADTKLPSVVLVNLAMFAAGVTVAFVSHWLLFHLNRYYAQRDEGAITTLYPSAAIWWFFPGFSALSFAWEITLQVWMRFNLHQANAYRAFSNVKSGFDSTKMLRILAYGVAVPIGIASLLALPIHTSLTDRAILSGHYAKFHEEVFPYAEALELIRFDGYTLRDGSYQARAGILVRFKDGRTWNSADTHDPVKSEDPELIQLLSDKTGLPTQHVQLEPK